MNQPANPTCMIINWDNGELELIEI
jgi:hypothetical protein